MMDKLLLCIEDSVKDKNISIESYIDQTTKKSLEKINYPLGIHGNVVYPSANTSVRKVKDDIYVPGIKDKFMLADKNFIDSSTGKPVKITNRMIDYEIMEKYKVPQPPVGWYMSEKFDGQRAIWDGSKFVSRGSPQSEPRVYPYVPIWFIALMPPGIALDGEFFIGRGKFTETTGTLKTKLKNESSRKELDKRWINIKYQVFDIPSSNELFEERLKILENIINERCKVWNKIDLPPYLTKGKCPIVLTKQYLIKSEEKIFEYYDQLVSDEAEGIMIRAPNIPYIPRRTRFLLKLKPEEEGECMIDGGAWGHIPGKGQFEGMLGSFNCILIQDGVLTDKRFNVGGMIKSIRMNYNKPKSEFFHPDGTIITFKYTEMTPDGIPRFPRYKGIRYDYSIK